MNNELIIFEAKDKSVSIPVKVDSETVWLNRNQIAELFDRDVKTIGKHINNALREELIDQVVVAKFATVQNEGDRQVRSRIKTGRETDYDFSGNEYSRYKLNYYLV